MALDEMPIADEADARGTTRRSMPLTRSSLFEGLRSLDERRRTLSWGEFHARYAPMIASFARRLGARASDVDDVIQEVMSSFLQQASDFQYDAAKGRFRSYLKVMTLRIARRLHGKTLRFQGVPLDHVAPEDVRFDPIWEDIWEQQLLQRALVSLRMDIGETTNFRVFEQYVLLSRPPEEVAAELKTSIDTVYAAKTRVTRALRVALSNVRTAED